MKDPELADIERRFNLLMERHNSDLTLIPDASDEDKEWLNGAESRQILTALLEWMEAAADERH